MKEIHLICNPTSGKGSASHALNKIKEWASLQPDLKLNVHLTENIGHATSIARDLTITNNPVTILVIGGDGSVNEVLNGIQNFENTTLGILPYGSGNDFVRAFGMNNPDPVKLFESYVKNPIVKKIDFLLLNDKYRAINEIGLGLCAEVIAMRNRMKHFSPKTQYKIATVIKSLFWKSFSYSVSVDGNGPTNVRSMWFTINNGVAIGGGMPTAPDAKIDDGLISIMFVKKFNHLKTLHHLLKAKKGKVYELKETEKYTCREIDLQGTNFSLEYDGNLLQNLDHINVKIIPGKLNLLVNKGE
ncbi:MAG: diacylglycerol/lipid kinase family protein [Mycoplasmoidaceae bacterium]